VIALAKRLVVIVAGFLLASLVAALVITIGVLMEWEEILRITGSSAAWLAVAFIGLIVSAKGLVPAMLIIALSESLRLRSPLFYAALGGAGLVGLYYALGLADRGPPGDILVARDLQIMAGGGIAGGFVYWAVAGRRAGSWRGQARA